MTLEQEVTMSSDRNSPLDATLYAAPTFADKGEQCWKVVDRNSDSEWWVIHFQGEWMVLPVIPGGQDVG